MLLNFMKFCKILAVRVIFLLPIFYYSGGQMNILAEIMFALIKVYGVEKAEKMFDELLEMVK